MHLHLLCVLFCNNFVIVNKKKCMYTVSMTNGWSVVCLLDFHSPFVLNLYILSGQGKTVHIDQGDHLSGKPGNIGNLTAVSEMSGILLEVMEVSGKKSCQGNVT